MQLLAHAARWIEKARCGVVASPDLRRAILILALFDRESSAENDLTELVVELADLDGLGHATCWHLHLTDLLHEEGRVLVLAQRAGGGAVGCCSGSTNSREVYSNCGFCTRSTCARRGQAPDDIGAATQQLDRCRIMPSRMLARPFQEWTIYFAYNADDARITTFEPLLGSARGTEFLGYLFELDSSGLAHNANLLRAARADPFELLLDNRVKIACDGERIGAQLGCGEKL